PPHHLCAVAPGLGGLALGPGGPHGDLEPGGGPALGHLGDVELGPARLDVVEVPPGEDVDPPDTGRRGQVADLGDGIGVLRHGIAHRWSSSPGPGTRALDSSDSVWLPLGYRN